MKDSLKYYLLNKWWIPLLIFFIASLLYFVAIYSGSNTQVVITLSFFLITHLVMCGCVICQFISKEWIKGGLQAILFLGWGCLFWMLTLPNLDAYSEISTF